MAGNVETNAEAVRIQGLIDRYLHFRSANAKVNECEPHLDEDLLTAFVEGRVSRRESPSVLKHLVECSFCLNVTSELARLNFAFSEEEHLASAPSGEPVKVSDVLSDLLSRIFGGNDGAVFAHHETEEEETEKIETTDEKTY